MASLQYLVFASFRFDLRTGRLWHDEQPVPLRPKVAAVLRSLLEHRGRLVPKEELLHAVWPDAVVTGEVLKVCIRALREALGDDAKTPRFIETIPRQGYRFIAAVVSGQEQSGVSGLESEAHPPQFPPTPYPLHPTPPLVGREQELSQLHEYLEKARTGARQLVFVTGEPGIGKTTLLDAFLSQLADDSGVRIGRGQCIEQHGTGEAYLPVLDALERLCRGSGKETILPLLREHAPLWLVQFPALLAPDERERLHRELMGTTRERMLREFLVVLEVLTATTPLVLLLEDLHWSDVSTLDLLAAVARRHEPAQLLLIATYRPVEGCTQRHPLAGIVQELRAHNLCIELALAGLNEAAIEAYFDTRFPQRAFSTRLAHVLHERTGGNPLFLVATLEDLLAHGLLVHEDNCWAVHSDLASFHARIPDSIRQLLGRQGSRLTAEEQQLLQAARLAGAEFSAAAVAAAVETDVRTIEARCEALAGRQQFLQRAGMAEWPDGTVAARYGFRHALYQQLWHEQVLPAQQHYLHHRLGERLEAAYGEQAATIATELALHFEQARDYQRAIQYHQQAATNASRRHAYQEAIAHLTTALAVLKKLPDTPARAQQELELLVALGPLLIALRGYTGSEVEQVYSRALALSQQDSFTPHLIPVLFGLAMFYYLRGPLQTALELSQQMLTLARQQAAPELLLPALAAAGTVQFHRGEFSHARTYLEQGVALYTPALHTLGILQAGQDLGVLCLATLAWALLILGYPEQALQQGQAAQALAQELAHPFTLALALHYTMLLSLWQRDYENSRRRAAAVIQLARTQGFPHWISPAMAVQGATQAILEQKAKGIEQVCESMETLERSGRRIGLSIGHVFLAEAYSKTGRIDEGLHVLEDGLAIGEQTDDRCMEAEVYRLKGELLQSQSSPKQVKTSREQVKNKSKTSQCKSKIEREAEMCFHKAIAVARRQSAKLWELRATVSLCRLWQQQGKRKEARQMLAKIYGWFTEGFETKDLQEAKALLDELS